MKIQRTKKIFVYTRFYGHYSLFKTILINIFRSGFRGNLTEMNSKETKIKTFKITCMSERKAMFLLRTHDVRFFLDLRKINFKLIIKFTGQDLLKSCYKNVTNILRLLH